MKNPPDEIIDLDVDEEKRAVRKLTGTLARVVTLVGVFTSLFHLYFALTGALEPMRYRSLHFSFFLPLVFIMYPARKDAPQKGPSFLDYILSTLALASLSYIWYFNYDSIVTRFLHVDPVYPLDIFFGLVLIVLIIEGVRRAVGIPLAVLTVLALLYSTNLGRLIPGRLGHLGFSLEQIIDQQYLTTGGIFGLPMGVSASYIFLFILFGAFLEGSGAGDTLIKLARNLVGAAKGGPAKIAVIASGLLGMISGSPVANVVTTGNITIPMMKRLGYSSRFAGAVEAAASSGGQIMPPIMGAAAFVLAEFTGAPYIQVAFAALVPACLYYLAIYLMIHFESERIGLQGLGVNKYKEFKILMRKNSHQLLPVVILIVLLVYGFTAFYAAAYSIISIPLINYIRKETRMGFKEIIAALEQGAKNTVMIAVALGAAGIVIGTINMTGIGVKMASMVLKTSGGSLILALPIIMVGTIILGMGIPTTAAYITASAVMVPAVVRLGIDPFVAHFFVFYFACLSSITPPVAVAAYAAAGIAQSDAIRTAATSCRLAIVAFIVPYAIVFSPVLLMRGEIGEIIVAILSAILGTFALAAGLASWLLSKTSLLERVFLLVAGILLIIPGLISDVFGIITLALVLIFQWSNIKKIKLRSQASVEGNPNT